jgi:hypothetical protein
MAASVSSRCTSGLTRHSAVRSCVPRSLSSSPASSRPCIIPKIDNLFPHVMPLSSRGQSSRIAAFDGGNNKDGTKAAVQFNPVYAAIFGGYAALFLLQNPYVFAALTILTIIPQNSSTTSLNSLVLLFYDSGIFMNFAGRYLLMQHGTIPPCELYHAVPSLLTCLDIALLGPRRGCVLRTACLMALHCLHPDQLCYFCLRLLL